jgi:hypothetical protein
LGLYLIRFKENDPLSYQFFLKWKNKLDMSDADLAFNKGEGYKELVLSYKSIYINTYNVQVIDITSDNLWTLFRCESF